MKLTKGIGFRSKTKSGDLAKTKVGILECDDGEMILAIERLCLTEEKCDNIGELVKSFKGKNLYINIMAFKAISVLQLLAAIEDLLDTDFAKEQLSKEIEKLRKELEK